VMARGSSALGLPPAVLAITLFRMPVLHAADGAAAAVCVAAAQGNGKGQGQASLADSKNALAASAGRLQRTFIRRG